MAQGAALSPAPAGHLAAVLASLLVLLALLLAALLYLKCRLSVQLWYQNAYGEVEMNGAWAAVPRVSAGGGFGGGNRDTWALEGSGEHISWKEGLLAGQEGTGPGSVLGRGRGWAWAPCELEEGQGVPGDSAWRCGPGPG